MEIIPPHCDQLILHAPGECEYCDNHPDWQALRQMWNVAFTGHPPVEGGLPCPSDFRRPNGVAARWPGNQARPNLDLIDWRNVEGR